jgi:hypothetical protein
MTVAPSSVISKIGDFRRLVGTASPFRDDNENQIAGRHERHTSEAIEEIEFPGMMELRDRFLEEIGEKP